LRDSAVVNRIEKQFIVKEGLRRLVTERRSLLYRWHLRLAWDESVTIGGIPCQPCSNNSIMSQVRKQQTFPRVSQRMVPAAVFNLILYELEPRQTGTVKAQMIGATCIPDSYSVESHIFQWLHPCFEKRTCQIVLL